MYCALDTEHTGFHEGSNLLTAAFVVVTVKLLSVAVSDKLNAISRASDVSIVLPPLYADCNVVEAAEHLTT